MIVDIEKEVDEVYLALEQAAGAMRREGHKPSLNILDCYQCYALGLIEQAKVVYLKRGRKDE